MSSQLTADCICYYFAVSSFHSGFGFILEASFGSFASSNSAVLMNVLASGREKNSNFVKSSWRLAS